MYRRRQRNNTLMLGILTFILFIVVVSLNMYPKIKKINVSSFFKDAEVKVVSVISKPFIALKNKILLSEDTNSLQEKYNKLLKQVDEIEGQNSRISALEKEIADLKAELNLNTTLGQKEKINATVINRIADSWNQKLTIDKGLKDNVMNGMPVINSKGLIGITTETSNHASSVKLLTSEDFTKISVRMKVDDHYVYGLLSGYHNGHFIAEGISENGVIKEGTVVTTTGMGTTFPSGLLIGKVSAVTTDNFDLAKIVEIIPSANFNDLTYVTVVRRDQNYDS